jgi:hypothetical protein
MCNGISVILMMFRENLADEHVGERSKWESRSSPEENAKTQPNVAVPGHTPSIVSDETDQHKYNACRWC